MAEDIDIFPPSRMGGLTGAQVASLVTEIKAERDAAFKRYLDARCRGDLRLSAVLDGPHRTLDALLLRVVSLANNPGVPRG